MSSSASFEQARRASIARRACPGKDLRQLFVFDPDGIQIEINIRSQPA